MRQPTQEQSAILEAIRGSQTSVMVNAYAGCGKTSTLEMLSRELPRRATLALAFNVKIKKELEQRLPEWFTVMTFNGLGHRAWARSQQGKKIDLDPKKLGKIVTEELKKAGMEDYEDAWQTVRELVNKVMGQGMTPKDFVRAGWIEDTETNWKQIADDNWLIVDDAIVEVSRRVLRASVLKAMEGVIDFDDQLYMPLFFGGQWSRFDIVLVDEAQDLSPLNHEQIKRVGGAASRLIVLGDPKQAIYSFRGADSASMAKLKKLRSEWIELPLATTFRCPKVIVARQQPHAPGFKAFETAPEGEFKRIGDKNGKFQKGSTNHEGHTDYRFIDESKSGGHEQCNKSSTEEEKEWGLEDLPTQGEIAILCRNNAPLLSIAFKIIRQGQGVTMLGRDIGKGLISLSNKICKNDSTDAAIVKTQIENWRTTERSKAFVNGDDQKVAGIEDRAECLLAVLEGAECKNAGDLRRHLHKLFEDSYGRITLSTGHRAKGLEWQTVVHLDPWRLPSKFARKNPAQMEQEMNLKYVIETRSKGLLIEANLEDFQQ